MNIKYTDSEGYEHTEVMSMQEYERRIKLPITDKDSLALYVEENAA